MNRREFVKKATLAGVASIGIAKFLSDLTAGAVSKQNSEIIVAYDGEPEQLLQTALAAYGGLGKLIKPGSTVVIKANFSWFGTPEKACTTNPDLLVALVKACQKAGAKKVRVVDLSIDPSTMCLNGGIKKAVVAAGGEIGDLWTVNLGPPNITKINSGVLKDFQVFTEALKADCLINVPILKTHYVTQMTGAIKNLMGLTPDRDLMHTQGIDQAIVDLAKVIKPHLHIIDAYRVMTTFGPQAGGNVVKMKQLILSHDPVAADAYGASLLQPYQTNFSPTFIKLAADAGLGTMNLKQVKITKIKC